MTLFYLFVAPRYRVVRLRLAFAIYLLVLVLGSIPGAREGVGHFASGGILHFSTYASIAALLFSGTSAKPGPRALHSCIVIAVMGALDEVLQSFFPYRTANIRDWTVDVAAGLFVCGILRVYYPAWQASLKERL